MDLAADLFPVRIGKGKDTNIGDTVDIDRGPGIVIKCAIVGGPPGGHGELEDIHFDLVIDKEGLQTAAYYKIFVFDLIPFGDEGLTFFEGKFFKMACEIV